ncbi:MAG: EAL domain-containing protein, partial [Spirochaetota bacterium]
IDKCEILLRMIGEDNLIIAPADFIPAAERYNLMPSIDRWVIKTALQIYKKIGSTTVNNPLLFSINLSAESIADETFLEYIYHLFKKNEVKPQAVCFEITETTAISNMATASKFIYELKDLGCTFALDDFGSGFSSFNYLKNMPIDFLKIDGSFIKDMDENPVNCAMVEAINNLGHVMRIKTIAECVRNGAILSKLINLQVDYAQGYELGKPEPLKTMLRNC